MVQQCEKKVWDGSSAIVSVDFVFRKVKLPDHENISQSQKKCRFVFGLNCSLKQTSIAPPQCCQKKNSEQNDETTSQRQSWWDPTSLYAERVREPSQHSQRESLRKRVWQLKESSGRLSNFVRWIANLLDLFSVMME